MFYFQFMVKHQFFHDGQGLVDIDKSETAFTGHMEAQQLTPALTSLHPTSLTLLNLSMMS